MSVKRIRNLFIFAVISSIILFIILSPVIAKASNESEVKQSVPWYQVEVTSGDNADQAFMRNYQKWVVCQVVPTAMSHCYDTKGIFNIKAAKMFHEGAPGPYSPTGPKYIDSDVHKVLEAMCTALQIPDYGDSEVIASKELIKSRVEEWIPYYEGAIVHDGTDLNGYLDTFYILQNSGGMQYQWYSNDDNHELYCQGHFIEAAVAHYRATQKINDGSADPRLFNVALSCADHIVRWFGPTATPPAYHRTQIPGHEEVELALVKLAKLCIEIGGEYASKAEQYLDTAAEFLGLRGHDWDSRTVDNIGKLFCREYAQDHKRVEEQTYAVGHAVRAQYLYTGMSDLAAISPEYAAKYETALKTLWDDSAYKKQYITGAVGDKLREDMKYPESFGREYELSNYEAYGETCAGIANMLWSRSMSTLYDGSQYADVIEKDMYNAVLGCANFDGNKFYYQNHLADINSFDRNSWFDTACCPPNYARTLLQISGFIYNTGSDDVYINQYISNNSNFNVGENNVQVAMKSGFPYNETGEINVTSSASSNFKIHLRKPSWTNNYSIKVNGKDVSPIEQDGYLVLSDISWSSTPTKIEFDFDMPLNYVKSDDNVYRNKGLVALQRGPIVYCMEACDNADTDLLRAYLVREGDDLYKFEQKEFLNSEGKNPYGIRTVNVLTHKGKYIKDGSTLDKTLTFVPYYSRCNRTLGAMTVLVRDGDISKDTIQEKGSASASYSSGTRPFDGVGFINDGRLESDGRWTNWQSGSVRKDDWVRLTYKQQVSFDSVRVWWFDDECNNGGVRKPSNGITLQTRGGNNVDIKEIKSPTKSGYYMYENIFTTSNGQPVTSDEITMIIHNTDHAAGIVEWELFNSSDYYHLDNIAIATPPTKTAYAFNEPFSTDGMVVNANYSYDYKEGGKTEQITDYDYSPKVFTEAGEQSVTITYTYKGVAKTTTQQVIVEEPELSSINIAQPPKKTGYTKGSAFKPDGMVVEGTYLDYQGKEVKLPVTGYTWSPQTLETIGENQVTISYTQHRQGQDDITKTAIQIVRVYDDHLQSIYVDTDSSKKEYDINDEVISDDFVVIAEYVDLNYNVREEQVYDFTFNPVTLDHEGDYTINISYTEDGQTKTASHNIHAYNPDFEAIKILANKRKYDINDMFNKADIQVTGRFKKHVAQTYYTENIADFTSSASQFTTIGKQDISITCTRYSVEKSATYNVIVYDYVLNSIEIMSQPTKLVYMLGEEFDKTGMVVNASFHKVVAGSDISKTITDYSCSHGKFVDVGNPLPVTISYTYGTTVKEDTLDVEVWGILNNIEVATQPAKTQYLLDEYFDPSGMVIEADFTDKDGEHVNQEVTNYSCSPELLTELGEQTVTVSYSILQHNESTNDNNDVLVTKTTEVKVNVAQSIIEINSAQTSDISLVPLILFVILSIIVFAAIQIRRSVQIRIKK